MVMALDEREVDAYSSLVGTFRGRRVGVLGDLVADGYVYGVPVRLSREAPVMILKHEREEFFPGGAANTVSNLLALGSGVVVFGMVGSDAAGQRIVEHLEGMGADVSGIVVSAGWRTIAKSRILAGDYHTKKQQVLRIDQEPGRGPTAEERAGFEERVKEALDRVDAWVVSDYGYQIATGPGVIGLVQAEAARGKVVVADSRYRVRDFRRITLVTPNEMELFGAYGIEQLPVEGASDDLVVETGRRLLEDLGSRGVLVTRGNRGMMLFEPDREPVSIPISGTSDIVDVSGAGDTVVSAATLALAGRSSLVAAARLSNVAAGVKVMKRGTVPVTASELLTAARNLVLNGGGPGKN
ncbi:MAG: carbohydrate kinase [Planctomycetes bacterium]|nr:carbohydrate kinase [Planctomycetota bacterium]